MNLEELILQRLDRLESKVDSLLTFRGWVLGVGAGVSGVVSVIAVWLMR